MADDGRPVGYAAGFALAAVALLVRALVDRWLGSMQPFASGFAAIAAVSWLFGWRPATLTALVSYLGAAALFVEPRGHLTLSQQDIAALLNFALASGIIILIGHRARIAERELARANAELRDADERKNAFLATLSHELRNPVAVILDAAALLEARPPDDRSRPAIAVLARQAGLMRRLIDDLLDVGRITRGRLTLRRRPVDVRTVVQDGVDACRHSLDAKHQTVHMRLPDAPVVAQVDDARLVQVMANLLDNASKYSPDRAAVNVTVAGDDGQVVIEVSDDGPGIDDDVLPRVFDIFEQGGTSPSGGLGLGLGLCKRLVELHGGRISARHNAGGPGTTFRVELPSSQ